MQGFELSAKNLKRNEMQAMMGSIIKGRWASSHGLKPESIYHCSIMPCYDKKLEASRDDFFVPGPDPIPLFPN